MPHVSLPPHPNPGVTRRGARRWNGATTEIKGRVWRLWCATTTLSFHCLILLLTDLPLHHTSWYIPDIYFNHPQTLLWHTHTKLWAGKNCEPVRRSMNYCVKEKSNKAFMGNPKNLRQRILNVLLLLVESLKSAANFLLSQRPAGNPDMMWGWME